MADVGMLVRISADGSPSGGRKLFREYHTPQPHAGKEIVQQEWYNLKQAR